MLHTQDTATMGHKPYFLLQSDMLAMKRLKVINASYYSMNIFGI